MSVTADHQTITRTKSGTPWTTKLPIVVITTLAVVASA